MFERIDLQPEILVGHHIHQSQQMVVNRPDFRRIESEAISFGYRGRALHILK